MHGGVLAGAGWTGGAGEGCEKVRQRGKGACPMLASRSAAHMEVGHRI